jgi:tetratricopeptide (TPR) repeat protein
VLTVQILVSDNRPTIERCLDSAFGLGARVVVGDLGSRDGTADFCAKMGAEVLGAESSADRSGVRNSLSAEGFNMYLEPWEFVAAGSGAVAGLACNSAFYVVQGGVVSKQVRFWGSGSFRNPVFEYLAGGPPPSVIPEVVIVSNGAPDSRADDTERCRRWAEKSPTSSEPYYYLACSLLAEGRLDEFLSSAVKYLAMDKAGGESATMMNYYMARVEASRGILKEASKRTLSCVASHPTFAEFWCLLADMFYSRGRYEKAISLYENARIIGRRRRSDDLFPVEVAKYESYPREMEGKCSEALGSGFLVAKRLEGNHI